jgi:hypothetical protein
MIHLVVCPMQSLSSLDLLGTIIALVGRQLELAPLFCGHLSRSRCLTIKQPTQDYMSQPAKVWTQLSALCTLITPLGELTSSMGHLVPTETQGYVSQHCFLHGPSAGPWVILGTPQPKGKQCVSKKTHWAWASPKSRNATAVYFVSLPLRFLWFEHGNNQLLRLPFV